jgi:hypothetical protein
MKELPELEGTPHEQVKAAVDWMKTTLDTPQGISGFPSVGKRTVQEIIDSGKIVASFGCVDKAAVLGTVLKANGFDAFIIGERMLINGKAVSIHFTVEVQKGNYKFVLDPKTATVSIKRNWHASTRAGKVSKPFEGSRDVIYERFGRQSVPENALNKRSFHVVGLTGRRDYVKASQSPVSRQIKYVLSRMRKKDTKRIQKIRQRKRPSA